MKLLFCLFLSILLLSCSSHSQNEKVANQEPEKDITGVWTHRYSAWNNGPEHIPNEWPFPDPPFDTFFVTDSTIDFFNYPYEFLYSYKYQRKGNKLTILNSNNNELTNFRIQLDDTLLHFSYKITYHNNGNDWIEFIEKYTRDSVDLSVLALLKKDTINYKLLEGKWDLNTIYSAEDGSEPIDLVFPLKFPLKFKFPIAQLDTATNKQLVQLKIEGKNRWFKIRMHSRYSFELMPYGWSLEKCPQIYYSKE